MNPARLRAYLTLLFVTAIWGIATPIIKYTLQGFPPLLFLTYRFAISSLIAIVFFFFSGIRLPKNFKLILLLIFHAFLNSVVALGLLFFGMDNTTVLETTLITLALPLLVSTAGVYFLHEHVTKREKIGMIIAVFGTILTTIEPLILNGHSSLKFSGNLLLIGYVLSSVYITVLGKKLLKEKVDPLMMANTSFIIGFIFLLPFALPQINMSFLKINYTYHLGVFYMAVFSGTLAYYLCNKAQKTIEIGEQSLFSYLYPIYSIPLAVFWLEEKITPMFIIGAIIIVIGVVVAEIKKKRYNT